MAVVVPSPATSLVLLAASLTSWAPMFSNLSSSSISLATETPSCNTTGAPHFLSIATFLLAIALAIIQRYIASIIALLSALSILSFIAERLRVKE